MNAQMELQRLQNEI